MTGRGSGLRYRLLRSWALGARRAQYGLRRLEGAVGAVTGAVLTRALPTLEKEALSIDLNNASFSPDMDRDGLYGWEQQWFDRRLPPAPASVLIGGAGAGREAMSLREAGYEVHALEPSTASFRLCRQRLGAACVDQASYRDLVDAMIGQGSASQLRLSSESRFDAVLLGWGSFGHVLESDDRLALLQACDRLAPHGPILLSIFAPRERSGRNGTHYTTWAGFLATPTPDELDRHARALGRRLIVSLEPPTSYATLLPMRSAAP